MSPRRKPGGYVGSNWADDSTRQLPLSREKGRHRHDGGGCGFRAALYVVIVIVATALCALGGAYGLRMIG